jgi:hypothetical protein
VTFIVPTSTPPEGLLIDDPQPKGCDDRLPTTISAFPVPGVLADRSPGAYSKSSEYVASPEQLTVGKVAEEGGADDLSPDKSPYRKRSLGP